MTEQREFTKALLDEIMLTAAKPVEPGPIMAGTYSRAVFVVYDTASQEKWDWRRTKRELRRIGFVRKGVRREYHKRAA
jgi:hypothetical protein